MTARQQKLVEEFLPYAKRCAQAMKRKTPRADLDDLTQQACLGLIGAARRFKPSRGNKFETFARTRIDGAMIDALRAGSWPRGIRKMRQRIAAVRDEFALTGRSPAVEELAERLKMAPERMAKWMRRIAIIELTSPESTLQGLDPKFIPRMLMPRAAPAADERHAVNSRRHLLLSLMMDLPPRDAQLLWLYYFEEQTMKEVGRAMGVNESRVSQIHARAIKRLRARVGPESGWQAPW